MIKKLLHVAYFFKSCDWKKLRYQSEFVREKYHLSRFSLFAKMIFCAYRYGISFHEPKIRNYHPIHD